MDSAVLWDRLTQVFQDVFEDPNLALEPATTAKDVEGWDSLTHIQLMVAVEKEFGVRFNTGEVAGLANVGEIVQLISRRTSTS